MTRRIHRLLCLVIAALLVAACTGASGQAVVTFQTSDGETFKVALTDAASIERVRQAMAADGRAGIPNGRLLPADGGINTGHEWHMEDMEIADVAIEVCDGTVSMVDEDVDYWINTVGRFCPWDARVLAIDDA